MGLQLHRTEMLLWLIPSTTKFDLLNDIWMRLASQDRMQQKTHELMKRRSMEFDNRLEYALSCLTIINAHARHLLSSIYEYCDPLQIDAHCVNLLYS
mmetsp:Transcript_29846/g.72795  ORF Transcript_29846/g.72795 Transcript_29846/m.72795 type:complete len:97 (-) Transcript_29846:12-302(-)